MLKHQNSDRRVYFVCISVSLTYFLFALNFSSSVHHHHHHPPPPQVDVFWSALVRVSLRVYNSHSNSNNNNNNNMFVRFPFSNSYWLAYIGRLFSTTPPSPTPLPGEGGGQLQIEQIRFVHIIVRIEETIVLGSLSGSTSFKQRSVMPLWSG